MTRSPPHFPAGKPPQERLSFKLRIEEKARDIAEYCGFSQGMCYSFESPKVFDKLLLEQDDVLRKAVIIATRWERISPS